MGNNPAIVISAFNRPASLHRLLASLSQAVYDNNVVDLVISIDQSPVKETKQLADSFEWRYGQKIIIEHPAHLGLKAHILSCGELTKEYGSIVLLEDDLMVSPYFYRYAKQAMNFYAGDERIAGISLYNYQVAENCFYPFKAIDDGSDVYFMQLASSWGQLWTKEQWEIFAVWFESNPALADDDSIPAYLHQWGQHSWKKHFIHYLIYTDRYFVFPRLSLSTNFEDAGTNASTENIFQVPLQVKPKEYYFSEFDESVAVYDASFELLPRIFNLLKPDLAAYDYEVDLYGTKKISSVKTEFILTSKKSGDAILSFSSGLFPLETNILLNLQGNSINLYKVADNLFSKEHLHVRNLLEELHKKADPGISITIPVGKFNETDLRKTLDSVQLQLRSECIVISSGQNKEQIEKILLEYKIDGTFVEAAKSDTLEQMLLMGFKKSTKEILTCIFPGSIFAPDAFEKVIDIFKSNLNVNWIRGIDGEWENPGEYAKLRTLKYRLTRQEAYRRLAKGAAYFSTEFHFLKSHCLKEINSFTSGAALTFKLLDLYQQITVVYCFGQTQVNAATLTEKEKSNLLSIYKHFRVRAGFRVQLLLALLRTPLVSDHTKDWLYPLSCNFPDVLRYDHQNKTFYYNKH